MNGWCHLYLVCNRVIEKGEDLWAFYGNDFSSVIQYVKNVQNRMRTRAKIAHKLINYTPEKYGLPSQ